LQNVVASLRRVVDKLKTENVALQRAANNKQPLGKITTTKSDGEMKALQSENVALKKQLKDAEEALKQQQQRSRGVPAKESDSDRVKDLIQQIASLTEQQQKLELANKQLEADKTDLKNELGAFDAEFFDGIEELKRKYQESLRQNEAYEKRLQSSHEPP